MDIHTYVLYEYEHKHTHITTYCTYVYVHTHYGLICEGARVYAGGREQLAMLFTTQHYPCTLHTLSFLTWPMISPTVYWLMVRSSCSGMQVGRGRATGVLRAFTSTCPLQRCGHGGEEWYRALKSLKPQSVKCLWLNTERHSTTNQCVCSRVHGH